MRVNIQHSKPTFSDSGSRLFASVFRSSKIASGRLVENFESKLSGYIGCAGALATNSGTSALHLSLLALNIGAGDEVLMPSYVCVSLLDAIHYVGAKPVLVDIDYDTFNMSLRDSKRKLTKKTRAIILPHMFGLPCDIKGFLALGLPIIEDCAQSLGAKYKGRPAGSFGTLTVFSFYATKIITTGYGGMVASHSKKLLAKMRDLAEPDKRQHYRTRYNYKMSDLEAALGLKQLARLNDFIRKRMEIAQAYTKALSDCGLRLPSATADGDHMFYRYAVKAGNPFFIKEALDKNGIEAIAPVHKPLHRYMRLSGRNFPNTERAYREVISLPIYPALKENEFMKVVRAIREASVR